MQSSNLLLLGVGLGLILYYLFVDRWSADIAGFFARRQAQGGAHGR